MEFPEAGKASAKKFLEYFLSKNIFPDSADDSLPITPNLLTMTKEEIEAECMDMAKTLLNKCSCPGLLSYNIISAAVGQLLKGSLDEYQVKNHEDTTETRYDGKLLALGTVQAVYRICQEWATQLPKLVCASNRPTFSVHAIKNTRRKMEDRHYMCVDINTLYGFKDYATDQSFFGVYDGHVGVEAASYAACHVHHNIIRHPAFLSDPEVAIKEGIRTTDEKFCSRDNKAGTTAVVALLRGHSLYIGWLGDSQAMLFRKGQAVEIMVPHKPDREDEQKRIEEAGGLVIFLGAWRVNGNLAVSRAIGDAKDKKFVIGEAEVTTVNLDGSEDYLVVACDGIWDVVNGEEMSDCMRQHFLNGGTMANAAKSVVEFAHSEGSGDNLTAIVVFFNSFKPPSAVQIEKSDNKADFETNKGSGSEDSEKKSVPSCSGSESMSETKSSDKETGSDVRETETSS